ncbi:MAG: single-stranded-DNA-specific exonuclease RecJ, partial [Clostridiales bacterium]|nr:single-stranded-DNA-specific exonuclease RecJ [Clostridiales bacterium]
MAYKKFSEHFQEILRQRGLAGEEEIDRFLFPKIEHLSDPFLINGIDKAAERIKKAVRDKEKILIFGDYDCDGICAIAILALSLKKLGLEASYFVPDRIRDGYGLTFSAIKQFIDSSP